MKRPRSRPLTIGRPPRIHGIRRGDPVKELMEMKGITCPCWDCLRAAGITPNRQFVTFHKDIFGNEYRTDNGKIARQGKAEKYVSKGEGRQVKKEAT